MSFQTTSALVYVDPVRNAAKFYEVAVHWAAQENEGHGAWIVTRRWGRLHTQGQASSVAFDHGADASAHADALVKAKLRKGYVRVDRIPPDVATAAANGTVFEPQPDAFEPQPDVFAEEPASFDALQERVETLGEPAADDVLALQAETNRYLAALGYKPIDEDGYFGPDTRRAIALLRDSGLVLEALARGAGTQSKSLQDILDDLMAVDVEETFSW